MRFAFLASLTLLVLSVGCGSSSFGSDGGPGGADSSGTAGAGGSGSPGTGGAPADHRAQAVACPTTRDVSPPDGGAVSCATDSDCTSDGGSSLYRFCLNHTCSVDQCVTDGDCASTEACGCANQFGGNIIHTNACVPTACHVDADCGAGGYCSPATNDRCGSLSGYHCHKAADTCHVDADCPVTQDGGITFPQACAYVPEVDHWACAPVAICNG
jgi:hypothetical protein